MPELREVEAYLVMKQRLQEPFHPLREQRMAAIVFVTLSYGHERWTKGSLTAFRNDHLTGFDQICCQTTDQSEFESPRSGGGFNELPLVALDLISNRRERLPVLPQ